MRVDKVYVCVCCAVNKFCWCAFVGRIEVDWLNYYWKERLVVMVVWELQRNASSKRCESTIFTEWLLLCCVSVVSTSTAVVCLYKWPIGRMEGTPENIAILSFLFFQFYEFHFIAVAHTFNSKSTVSIVTACVCVYSKEHFFRRKRDL